jgi:predicted RNA binding protein YcfA (HicA-like mRNA interferase family)
MALTEYKRRQKRRRKLAQNPTNVRFEDLRRLLEDYGFELKRSKGSHHSFVGYLDQEKVTIVIPFRKPLQEVYVKRALDMIEQIEPLGSDQEETESDDDEQDT